MADTDAPVEAEVVAEETLGESPPDIPGVEMVRAGDAVPAPTTLFRTDDPVEVIKRATEVANALSDVLRSQKGPDGKLKLISKIGNREHVNVEGWTLCGTMLGVFAVPIWTKKLTDPEGWEARVEARTLSGAVIGAAEAQCTRDEKQWGFDPRGRNGNKLEPRDDFALRSMAQTRATSKALRLPLGFIVELAGFAATPAEEIDAAEVAEPQGRRVEGPPPYPVPTSWPKVLEAARACDNADESEALYEAFLQAATFHQFGELSLKAIDTEQRKVMFQKAAGAVCWLHDTDAGRDGPFAFYREAEWRQAWMHVMDGHRLEIPNFVPPEPPEAEEALERIAAESAADEGAHG